MHCQAQGVVVVKIEKYLVLLIYFMSFFNFIFYCFYSYELIFIEESPLRYSSKYGHKFNAFLWLIVSLSPIYLVSHRDRLDFIKMRATVGKNSLSKAINIIICILSCSMIMYVYFSEVFHRLHFNY